MDKYIELLIKNPFLLWFLLGLAIFAIPLIIAIVVTGIKQGRELKTPIPSIGPRIPDPNHIRENEFDEIVQRVRNELDDYRQEQGISEETLSPDLPIFPEHTIDLFKMELIIGRKIRDIVLGWGGGWAGASWAEFESFYSLARTHNLVSEEIMNDIGEFKWISVPGILGDELSNDQFNDAKQLAGKILRELDAIEIGPNYSE